jgi:hypothetical protein
MHFGTKSYLKSIRNHTTKHVLYKKLDASARKPVTSWHAKTRVLYIKKIIRKGRKYYEIITRNILQLKLTRP